MNNDLPHLPGYIEQLGVPETLEDAIAERNAWVESAAQFNRNEEYYRGLLDEIAVEIGPDAYTADDGTVYDTPVRAKIPELVRAMADEFYIIWSPEGETPPQQRHFTYKAASTGAWIMSRRRPGRSFYVMKAKKMHLLEPECPEMTEKRPKLSLAHGKVKAQKEALSPSER